MSLPAVPPSPSAPPQQQPQPEPQPQQRTSLQLPPPQSQQPQQQKTPIQLPPVEHNKHYDEPREPEEGDGLSRSGFGDIRRRLARFLKSRPKREELEQQGIIPNDPSLTVSTGVGAGGGGPTGQVVKINAPEDKDTDREKETEDNDEGSDDEGSKKDKKKVRRRLNGSFRTNRSRNLKAISRAGDDTDGGEGGSSIIIKDSVKIEKEEKHKPESTTPPQQQQPPTPPPFTTPVVTPGPKPKPKAKQMISLVHNANDTDSESDTDTSSDEESSGGEMDPEPWTLYRGRPAGTSSTAASPVEAVSNYVDNRKRDRAHWRRKKQKELRNIDLELAEIDRQLRYLERQLNPGGATVGSGRTPTDNPSQPKTPRGISTHKPPPSPRSHTSDSKPTKESPQPRTYHASKGGSGRGGSEVRQRQILTKSSGTQIHGMVSLGGGGSGRNAGGGGNDAKSSSSHSKRKGAPTRRPPSRPLDGAELEKVENGGESSGELPLLSPKAEKKSLSKSKRAKKEKKDKKEEGGGSSRADGSSDSVPTTATPTKKRGSARGKKKELA